MKKTGGSHMKTLFVAACLIFAGLLALTVYTHYDTEKFIESLPQAPTKQREVSAGEKTPAQYEARTPENQGEQTLDDPLSNPHAHGHLHEHPGSHGHTHPHDLPVESSTVSESDATQHMEEPVEAPSSGEQLPPGVVTWKISTPGERPKIDREAFLAEFGDHPKAHTYLALHSEIYASDSYTYQEIYEYEVLNKEFTQSIHPSPAYLETMRKRAAEHPNRKIRSWFSYKDDPNYAGDIILNP
jgi:hypothetical protein